MRPRRILDGPEAGAILANAVNERALAVISVRLDDAWYTFKSRFLERDADHRFFVLDFQETHGTEPPPIEPGQHVGISFRHKSRKLMFASVIEAKGRFCVNGGENIPAIRYRWPESLIELQRRAYYRTIIPAGTNVRATLWAGGVNARAEAQTQALSVWGGDCLDLSCGGTLIRLGDATAPDWPNDQVVGLELHLPDGRPPVMLDAYYRGARRDETGLQCLATQFVGLEVTQEGRAVLGRLARCVQRFHRNTSSHRPSNRERTH